MARMSPPVLRGAPETGLPTFGSAALRSGRAPMLRLARRSNAEAVAALQAASWQRAYRGILSDAYLDRGVLEDRQAVWENRFAQPSPLQHVIVADDGGLLLGFACVYLNENPIW